MPATQTTRSRAVPCKVATQGHVDLGNGSSSTGDVSLAGKQVTASTGHPFSQHKGNLNDIGGDFYTSKSWVVSKPRRAKLKRVVTIAPGITQTRSYEGLVLPYYPAGTPTNTLAFPPASNSSNAALDKLGATAIARCAPGNPPSDLATFLGELRQDGLPALVGASIWKSRTQNALKASGNDYLNASFGWAPMLSDISSFARSISKSDSLIRQYERDAGKVVRRRYYFPSQRDVQETTVAFDQFIKLVPSNSGFQDVASGNKVTRIRETSRSQWFSGAFTYYLPTGYDSRKTIGGLASKAEFLLGTSLTPQTLWNITPWSWAVDWFSNTGDVIKNVQRFATGGLIMRYGYMMEHTIVTDTYTYHGSPLIAEGAMMPSPLILRTETKVRRGANPFGFGVSWDALSAFQTSILVALGITHRH
jgi:hypothetical protein